MADEHWSWSLLNDRRTLWCIAIVAAILSGIANLPWQLDDYDQAKQAFSSFQTMNDGRWLYQTTPHERIATKPPLVAWFSTLLYTVTRSWELAWRLPSVLAAGTIAVLLFRSGKVAYGNAAGVVALAAFALNLISPRLATLVRTDMPLALVVLIIGVLIWHKIRTQEPWQTNDRLIVFLSLTAGMFIKGPVVLAFLLPGIVAFQLWRSKPGVSAFPGWWPWIASLGIFLAWVVGGIRFVPGFYDDVVMREFLGRFGGAVHRSQPLVFYVLHLLHKFAPWSLLMIALALIELRSAKWAWRRLRISSETRWLLCWSVGGLVLMSLLPSKRVDRIFPVIPPLCLLLGATVGALSSRLELRARINRWSAAAVAVGILTTGSYVTWKVISGYREHRGALAEFGGNVQKQAAAQNWRYAVVSAPDESLLLYLRKTAFARPHRAVADWNDGKVDALVVSTRHSPDLLPQLNPAPVSTLRSGHREGENTLDYLLITRHGP